MLFDHRDSANLGPSSVDSAKIGSGFANLFKGRETGPSPSSSLGSLSLSRNIGSSRDNLDQMDAVKSSNLPLEDLVNFKDSVLITNSAAYFARMSRTPPKRVSYTPLPLPVRLESRIPEPVNKRSSSPNSQISMRPSPASPTSVRSAPTSQLNTTYGGKALPQTPQPKSPTNPVKIVRSTEVPVISARKASLNEESVCLAPKGLGMEISRESLFETDAGESVTDSG